MDIKDSAIWEEVRQITESGAKSVNHNWACEIVAGDETIVPLKLIDVDVTRQYNTKFSDEIMIKVLLPRGTYNHRIYPQRDDLRVTLFKEAVTEVGGGIDEKGESIMRTYRGVLAKAKSTMLESASKVEDSEAASDLTAPQEYRIQLVDLAAERLRMKTVGGIYRDMTTSDVVKGVLGMVSANLQLDEASTVQGIDVVPGNNDQVRDHVIVPQGTQVVKFPEYVHEQCGGIYSTSIGYYLQQGIWYVYPLFNLKRFTTEPRNLTVFNIPPNRLPNVERTFDTDGDRISIIATGQTKQKDDSEDLQLQFGNGVRYLDANRVIDNWREVNDNVATVARSDNMRQIKLSERRVGLNQAPMSPRRITANPYLETSELSRRMGMFLQVEWQNADPDLIYPGMPVRYVYMEKDTVNEVFGTVLGADHVVAMSGRGVQSSRYHCTMVLTLFVERPPEPS